MQIINITPTKPQDIEIDLKLKLTKEELAELRRFFWHNSSIPELYGNLTKLGTMEADTIFVKNFMTLMLNILEK